MNASVLGSSQYGRAGVTWMPDWLLAPSSVKELDSYVKSLYSLAQSSDYQKKNEEDLTLMDSLALRKLSFEVRLNRKPYYQLN